MNTDATTPRHSKNGERIFGMHPNVFFLGMVSFLTDVSSEMVFTILPLFLANVLGAGTTVIGLIGGVTESADALLRIFSGWLSDRLQKRKSLAVLGYSLSTLAKPFMYLATTWGMVLGVRFADRVGKGIRTSPRDALIADSTSAEKRGKGFGFHSAMDTAGAALGLAIAAALVYLSQKGSLELSRGTYQQLVLGGIIPAIIAVLLLVFFVREIKGNRQRQSRDSSDVTGIKALFSLRGFDRQFKVFLAIMALFTLGNSSDAFLILRAQNLGISVFHVFLVLILFNAVYAAISTPAGVWSDKVGRKRLIALGWLVYALTYLGFALASSQWQVWLLFALYGMYYGMTQGVARAFVADMVPVEKRGTAYGLYHGVVGLTLLPASLLAGWLWQRFTPATPFLLGAGLSTAATVALLTLIKERPKRDTLK